MKRWLLAAACGVVALGLLLYPLVGELLSEKYHSDVETAYTAAIEDTDDAELTAQRQAAQQYNAMLANATISEGGASAPPLAYADQLTVGGVMAYIDIPKINVYLPVQHGTGAETLERSVGHVVGTSLPVGGSSTHAVLSAHSGMASSKLFSDIDQLEKDDTFYIHVLGEVLAYEVDNINTVLPTDTSLLQIEDGKDLVTLVTCTPFGINTHRLLVRGHRVPYTPEQASAAEEKPVASSWTQHYLTGLAIGLGAVVVVGGGYAIIRRKRHIPNIRGGTTWGHSAVRGILSNEKYVGDVLMQKTFRQDCISHKAIRNTGQRPMYLVQNNHEAIIDRKTYDAAQTELARRTAIKGTTEKSTPSGRSSYMPMYALSERVFCGECGTRYRRCTWVNKGKKHIVWRCVSRIDYGKKYCHASPSVDEQQLQQAILRAINSVMSDKPMLVRQVTENLQVVIHPSRSGELTIAEIDHQLEMLAQEFDAVFTTAAPSNSTDYIERFKAIFAQQAELKAKRAELEQRQAEDAELTSHMELAADTLEQARTAITEWDEYQIRALVESVRILSKDEILVRLKSGIEVKEHLV